MSAEQAQWFGADVEESNDGKTVEFQFDGYKGVDSDVPRTVAQNGKLTQVLVRKPAPSRLRTKTFSTSNPDIARLTAWYKTMREGFRFAPNADKEMWERRTELAYHQMQVARFRESFERETEPTQKRHLKTKVAYHRGMVSELVEQGVK